MESVGNYLSVRPRSQQIKPALTPPRLPHLPLPGVPGQITVLDGRGSYQIGMTWRVNPGFDDLLGVLTSPSDRTQTD